MRVRPVPLLAAIFGTAAVTAAFVVSQLRLDGGGQPSHAPAVRTPDDTSPSAPVATERDGAVEVRVTADRGPQAGADVRLYLAPAAEDAPWLRAGRATTGPDGVARILARPGSYLVAARAPGHAAGHGEVVRAVGEDVSRVEVELEPGQALFGKVRVPGGAPAPRVRIQAIPSVPRWPGLDPPGAPAEETIVGESDAAGAFRVDGLSPGTWALSIAAAGYHPVLVPRVAVPGEALEIVLEPLGAIEGTVVHADGRPAPGALVRAASAEHGAAARAGPDGRFRLAAPAGSYVLDASLGSRAGAAAAPIAVGADATVRGVRVRLGPAAAVHAEITRAGGAPASGAVLALSAHDTHEITARAVAGPDGRAILEGLAPGAHDARVVARGATPAVLTGITLAPGASFPLRVELRGTGSVQGTVRDPAGRALAGVRVRAARRDAVGPIASPAVEARTDFDGRFRLDGVEIGRVEVVARLPGVLAGVARALEVREGEAERLDLVLPEAGLLAGRVGSAGGPPPAGTTVVAIAMASGPATLQVARVTVDASGEYLFALPAGEYRVYASPGDAARTDLRVAPAFARVEPRRTSRLDLALPPPGREEGVEILVLEPGGVPSPGAIVTLARPDDGRIALATAAGDDGRVTIGGRMGIAGRPVTIRARSGGRTLTQTVELPAAGTVAVRLSPAGSVEGVVSGAGVSGFTLEISSRPDAGAWRTLDVHRFAGDRFVVADLPAEPLRLAVRANDGRRGSAEVRVAPGERRRVEIALR